jgi:Protein of unknown function (DUF3631)
VNIEDLDVTLDGGGLLSEVHAALTAYVIFPSGEAADAAALYAAATHAQSSWEHATRLLVKSPEKRCGKSRLLEILRELVNSPRPTVNISAAALVRSIHPDNPPVLIVDEADRLYGSKVKSETNEDLTAILDAGFARGWPYTRYNPAKSITEDFPTFCMAILASKGVTLPDTIEDRSVIIPMRRKAPGEQVASFRRRDVPELTELRGRLHTWVSGHVDELAKAEPAMPVDDRAADCWEPLVAIGDLAGDDWPARARKACTVLTGDAMPSPGADGLRLLADLRTIFGEDDAKSTAAILAGLLNVDESPWGDVDGKPLNAYGLAERLRPYGVKPRQIRVGETTPRGYRRADLHEAWTIYCPPDG